METDIIQETKLLYDDVRQLLYCIMLGFQSSELQKLNPEIQRHFTELKESTSHLFNEIQRTATGSHYLVLTTFGFLPAIRRWAEHCEDEFSIGTVIETKGIEEGERWPEEQELALYLLCKDLIFQTSRHMTRRYGELSLMITKQNKEFRLFFHASLHSIGEDWWCSYLLRNPLLWKDMQKYHRSFQVLLEESGVTIIASFD